MYNPSVFKVIERLRQIYLKPLVRRDLRNRFDPLDIDGVEIRLQELGVPVEPHIVNWADFENYRAHYAGRFGRWNGNIEKQFEYFMSERLLSILTDDIVMDVGSWLSPYPDLIRERSGCRVYAQDLSYPEVIHGWRIGGDAARLPLPDRSVSKITLHCTFEHFENDSDVRFVPEVERVLADGGRMVIVPLYLHQDYTIWTDPSQFHTSPITVDSGATLFRKVGWNNRFGRHYSPDALKERIVRQAQGLSFKVLRIANIHDLDQRCYMRFVGLFQKTT